MKKENAILDILYDSRSREFQGKYIRSNGKPKEVVLAEKLETEFINFVEKNIKDKRLQKTLISKFEKVQENNLAEMILWEIEYYKLGFLDGIELKEELEKSKRF